MDRGTHIEWLPDNTAGTITEEQIAVELAKKNKCDAIEWDTSRPVNAWQRLAKNIGQIEVVTRQLRIEI